MLLRFYLPLLLFACVFMSAGRLCGDVFLLNSGGRIEGQWINRDDPLSEPYRIETTDGLRLTIDRKCVKQFIGQRSVELKYEQHAPAVPDTADAQWKLAEWCRAHHLPQQREAHLRRILQLNPDHLPARRALGFAQVDGQWLTREQANQRKGLKYFRGRWRTAQDIAIMQERDKTTTARREWSRRLRVLREKLAGEIDEARAARDEILAIKDPHAVAALGEWMGADPVRPFKLIYIAALCNIGGNPANEVLVASSLYDPDEEIRVACLDRLKQLDAAGVDRIYIKALANQNNHVVNRAAYALARFGDQSAVAPLIDALVTRHTYTYTPPKTGGPETVTTSFTNTQSAEAAARPNLLPGGTSSGLSMGSQTKTITRDIANEEVLTALIQLTRGPNYGYNEAVWKQWLEAQHRGATVGP